MRRSTSARTFRGRCARSPRRLARGAAATCSSPASRPTAPSVPPNYDESAPLAEVGDPEATEVTDENYGGLKVACEQVSAALFGPDTTIIRPTYVIGPYDRSYRFTWWVDRIARGGTVLAPGSPDDPIQLIDARDQAAWIVSLLERSITGTFHAVSPAPPFGFGQMLEAIAAEVAPAGTQLAWADSSFLLEQGVDGAALPLWAEGEGDAANMSTADPAAAFATGLTPRPLRQTVADIRAEDRDTRHRPARRRHLQPSGRRSCSRAGPPRADRETAQARPARSRSGRAARKLTTDGDLHDSAS